eukprot:Skav209625  [mRNA]  locus=scaffold902:108751:111012:+ [translate_table: standard]
MCHILCAFLCGRLPSCSLKNLMNILLWRQVQIPMGRKSQSGECEIIEGLVRHAGWVGSTALMVLVCSASESFSHFGDPVSVPRAAAAITMLEAFLSDFWSSWPHPKRDPEDGEGWFLCGNFGMVLLNEALAASSAVKDILETMAEVTMMRGAQSGGVVTFAARKPRSWFWSDQNQSEDVVDCVGLRSRVVSRKRSTLSKLLIQHLDATERWTRRQLLQFGRIYAGHTRFATSSKATWDGVHPHQWSKPQQLNMYDGWSEGSLKRKTLSKNFEIFVTHNGDFDFFEVGGRSYELGSIQAWLERVTWQRRPSDVDSAAIAGVMDLLRTQGSTELSARFGFLFGVDRPSLNYEMPPPAVFQRLGALLDQLIQEEFAKSAESDILRLTDLEQQQEKLVGNYVEAIRSASIPCLKNQDLENMAAAAVNAFFQNDLLHSTRLFMMKARGSFGLSILSSVDAHRQMIIASFGQSMSVAFYPESKVVLYASEPAALKAALGVKDTPPEPPVLSSCRTSARFKTVHSPAKLHMAVCPKRSREELQRIVDLEANMVSVVNGGPAIRIDLDDLGGEICLLDWGSGLPSASSKTSEFTPQPMMNNLVTMTSVRQTRFSPWRLIPLEDNPLICPLPPKVSDPVGNDIKEIPQALNQIQMDWRMGAGPNRASAWCLGRALCNRLRDKQAGKVAADAVDLLITGCEATWLQRVVKCQQVLLVSVEKYIGSCCHMLPRFCAERKGRRRMFKFMAVEYCRVGCMPEACLV